MKVSVRTGHAADRAAAISTIVMAFSADPMMRWGWPSASAYLSAMAPFSDAFGGRAFDSGTAHIAGDGEAVALWLPPGVDADGDTMWSIIEQTVDPSKLEDAGAVLKGMAGYHPHEPHWYLAMIGTDPNRFGQGLGTALMDHALRQCDADGLPAYLESSNPRNISLYERHGFEALGAIQSGTSPTVVPMLRQPRKR
jgi:ribosomal protein S18 acetylase RimI-like enzyme